MNEPEKTTAKLKKLDSHILDYLEAYIKGLGILLLDCPSKYLQWKLFKVLKEYLGECEIKHADIETLKSEISSNSQGSLFDDLSVGNITCLFFKGKISDKEYALFDGSEPMIVFADSVDVNRSNVIKAVNQRDKLIELFFDYFRSQCENLQVWQGILQSLDRDDDLGKIFYSLEVLLSLEGVITKEGLLKYDLDWYSASMMFELQNMFAGKKYSIRNWKGLFTRFALELPTLRSYLKNLGEKLMFLEGKDSIYEGPIKSMHPYAKKKLEETVRSPGWKSKGVFKLGQLLKYDRLLRQRTVNEENLIKSLVS